MGSGRLGPYRLLGRLGSGGMGAVHLAEVVERVAGLDVGTRVALKVIHPHLLERPGFFKRFLREARIGRAVEHDNVVRCYDCDARLLDGVQQNYLAMEYVEGRTLRRLLEDLGTVPEELCRHIGREVARGLEAIHAVGAVHRDLKPENVIITPEHVVKIMDLGVAHLSDEAIRLSQTGAFVGSVGYAAPEQFRGHSVDVDGRTDLHALGVILYELASGHHPFRDEDPRRVLHRVLRETPPPAGGREAPLSPFFEEVLSTLLAKEREDRLPNARRLREILEEGEEGAWWQQRRKNLRLRPESAFARWRAPRETALHGRDAELGLLLDLHARAAAGHGQVLLLEGEAGIGKTRLVEEVADRLAGAASAPLVLLGAYPPGGAGSAAGPFSEALRQALGTDDLERTLAEPLRETPLLLPAFAAVLRGDAWPPDALPLLPAALPTLLGRLLGWLARDRPVLLAIEDLHNASGEGLTLFAAVAGAVRSQRVLLVGTARPRLPEAWVAGITTLEHGGHLALSRLGARDLARLLAEAFRSERLAEELSFRIAQKSDGNPFFVFELVRGLRESSVIRRSPSGSWVRTSAIRHLEIPSSVHDLVSARLAELGDEDRALLDVAACWGHAFDPTLVGAALDLPRLSALTRFAKIERKHGLVRSEGRACRFDHHLVQETLYEGLGEQLREAYHGLLADVLEHREGEAGRAPEQVAGETAAILAAHFLRGPEACRAAPYVSRGMDHLEGGWRNEDAIDLCERALAAPGLLRGRARVEILLRLASRCDLVGLRERQVAVCGEAQALAREVADPLLTLRVATSLARAHLRAYDADGTHAALDEAEGALETCADPEWVARVHGLHGVAYRWQGRYEEARASYERQLAVAREAGLRHEEALASGNLGRLYGTLGRHAEARRCYERDLELSAEVGDRMGEAAAALNLGVDCYEQGDYPEARRFLERGLTVSRAIGYCEGEEGAIGNLGILAIYEGRLDEARERFEMQLSQARDVGDRESEGIAIGNLGDVDRLEGHREAARANFEVALKIAAEIGDPAAQALAQANVAQVLLEAGATEAAAPRLRAAFGLARGGGLASETAFANHVLGLLRLQQGLRTRAEGALRRAGRLYARLGERHGHVRAVVKLVGLLLDEGRDEEARAAWQEAQDEIASVRALRLRAEVAAVASRLGA